MTAAAPAPIPPPGVIDPVQDAITAITTIKNLVGKAQAAGGTLAASDWQAMTTSYERLAEDVYALSQKKAPAPPPPAPSSGVSTGATVAIAGATAVVAGVIGFGIGRATAVPHGGA